MSYDRYDYFAEQERLCIDRFDADCRPQASLLMDLLDHMELFVSQLSENISDDQYPSSTIEAFLVYNLTLIYKAFDSLRTGYFGIAFSGMRPVAENLSLSLYFYEFPEEESEYRTNRKSFYDRLKKIGFSGWIQGLLKRIDRDGTKLNKHGGNPSLLETLIYKGIGEEASDFLHANPDKIRFVTFSEKGSDRQLYTFGPNYLGSDSAKLIMLKILSATVLNLMATDKIFENLIVDKDVALIDRATSQINLWNKELATMAATKKRKQVD